MPSIELISDSKEDIHELSLMVGELLTEIMETIDEKAFNYNQVETENRAHDLLSRNVYWVFLVKDIPSAKIIGFVSLYESFALYSEGAYGTIPELYVRPKWRSQKIGKHLLEKVVSFAKEKNWRRLEVTTPPLPEFEKTLQFYQKNGFEIAGGRKLKINI